MDSDNEGVENIVIPTDIKWYRLRNPPNVNCNNKRATGRSIVWNNLIVGSNELQSVAKSYVNVVNAMTTFVKPTPPTNIINNDTILENASSRRESRYLVRRERLQYENNYSSFMIA